MPKHLPQPNESDLQEILMGGRIALISGIRYAQKITNQLFDEQLESLLQGAGIGLPGVRKPVRTVDGLQAAERSLLEFTKKGLPRKAMGRPRKQAALESGESTIKASQKAWWAQYSKEERQAIMADRYAKRGQSKNTTAAAANGQYEAPHMIGDRYTKAGVAALLNVTLATATRRVKGLATERSMDPVVKSGKRPTFATYAAADIEALGGAAE